ncbi:MAG: protein kinase domain-containing protein [Actinomycetota bacterium]
MTEQIEIIKDRFRIDSLIAYGGMARVYKGTDLTLARTVAIKVLSDELARDPAFILRFRREAQAAAGLAHPNIVAVYDTGEEAGLHYIVMEYVEGRTLQQILADDGPMRPDAAAQVGAEIALALAEAHKKGLVHRDVKPGNIMIAESGLVKVMDFGIAKAATSAELTQVGSILGTVAYLSPEQARGDQVDGRSDIYALGALMYQMLTGRAPFAAQTLVEMLNKLNNQVPTSPSLLNPAVSPALEGVVMKALAKDPARRHQEGGELAEQLLLSLTSDPPSRAVNVPPAGVRADRTLVAPAAGLGTGDGRTRVLPPSQPPPRSSGESQFLIGAAALIALLLLGFFIFSSLTSDLDDPVEPAPPQAVTTTAGRALIQPVAPTTLPQAVTTTVVSPSPEPSSEPTPEPSPDPEPTQPPPSPDPAPSVEPTPADPVPTEDPSP